MPIVSIIMGIYNCENTLKESLDSIIKQTFTDWELILCDDGSCDNTYQIAKEYACSDNRIVLIKNEKNLGLAKTLNNCLKLATGYYILRHDGDDIMVPDRIEKQVAYMQKYGYDVCGSGAYMFDDKGVWGIRVPLEYPKKECMILGSPFIHATVIIKKEKLLEVGGYTENYLTEQRLEDYDLWIKLYENDCKMYNIQEPLIYFREDRNSYKRKKKKFRLAETRARFMACRRLNISGPKKMGALKPLLMIFIPNYFLMKYHLKAGMRSLKMYSGGEESLFLNGDKRHK